MDVLAGSIDVRDLLSAPDLDDPSTPLSAPDLRLLIDRLHLRSVHIQRAALQYALSHRRDLAAALSRSSRAAASSASAASALSAALSALSSHPPLDAEIRSLARDILSAREELAERREALGVVAAVSALHARLRAAREGIRAGRVVEAAEAVRDLKCCLSSVCEEGGGSGGSEGEPAVFGFLRKEWTDCFDELQAVLVKIVDNSVKFEPEKGRVIVSSKLAGGEGIGVELDVALRAMEIVDVLDYGMAKIADLMIKHVMVPAISNSSVVVSVEVLNQEAVEKPEAILNVVPSLESQDYQDGSALYSRLIEIIKFICKFICLENRSFVHCFGKLTWSRISNLIITHFLSKAVPDVASKLIDFEDIIRCTIEFETKLKDMIFISTDAKEEKLSQFVHDVEVHFASRKRSEILAKARNILVQYDYPDRPITEEGLMQVSSAVGYSSEYVADLLFQPEKCYISKSATQLMKLVHETLKDACLSSTRVAKEFYHAARDALLLYKAIVPVKLGKQLDSVSQVAINVYNDFLYLSQEILGLAFEYRADFPSGLQKDAVFVDMGPTFYQIAEDILEKQIQLVISSLKEAIDSADGFENTHQSQQYEAAKFSVEQVIFILEKVHIMWEPYMPALTYKRSMRITLDYVFSRITKDMLLLDDMAAEETLQLQRLIHLMLENLSSLFESFIAKVDGKDKVLNHMLWAQLDEMLPSLRKFHLFDMPLKSITEAWESGELIHCGFTSNEVVNFIKAVFTDSPLRKECLWRIGSSSAST
ncbi:centromere/kinetochore protein zw10 homolog isoform X2 [Ananas comosus]|uniref:Centromere/kinetochore protein zw10 homolog isoform X2 n=1 Tax=Ananas comosus TaxID=4615 RepID=A0A6P5G3B6_ANACO|nr:centromere/kinetochore protein zw10 homolog isoform X2 [Ananas comosus]